MIGSRISVKLDSSTCGRVVRPVKMRVVARSFDAAVRAKADVDGTRDRPLDEAEPGKDGKSGDGRANSR